MVLARIAGAPEGVKGISLFLVPKFLVNADGSLGERNDVHCLSIEHKLGIHASPTCVMSFGEREGAVGYLIGEANRGLEYMFIMMNVARLAVGLQGYAVTERAFQQAADYARTRVQGRNSAAAKGAPALVGALRYDTDSKLRNSLFVLTDSGTVAGFYDKWHLVPFGEYQPSWFPAGRTCASGFSVSTGRESMTSNTRMALARTSWPIVIRLVSARTGLTIWAR